MPYRRYPSSRRRTYNTAPPIDNNDLNTIEVVEKGIPLPNELDSAPETATINMRDRKPSFLDGIFKRIGPEEIIIIGVLVILLLEGITDEFLILILLYLLFT